MSLPVRSLIQLPYVRTGQREIGWSRRRVLRIRWTTLQLAKGVLLKMVMGKDVTGRREVGEKRRKSQGSDYEDPLQPHELAQAMANPPVLAAPRPY